MIRLYAGRKLGKLTLIGRSTNTSYWRVKCACGFEYELRTYQLTRRERPARHCRNCGYVASSGERKREAALKIPAEIRRARASLGGAPHSPELRREALELFATGEATRKDIAIHLGISEITVGRWVREAEIDYSAGA